jgi:hypothetical protein
MLLARPLCIQRLLVLLLLSLTATTWVGGAMAVVPAPGTAPTFDPPSSKFLVNGCTMPVSADFDLDGKPDIAGTDQVNGLVIVASGPGFTSTRSFPTGNTTLAQPVYLAIGDFNKDGKPDLVVVNRQENSACVLLNTTTTPGSLTFSRTIIPIPLPANATGIQPAQVAVADVDGDGNPDFATANYLSNTIAVFFGDGSGTTFLARPVKHYALQNGLNGTNPNSLVFTDLNRDGRPDVVVGANNGSQLFVFLNTGSATDPYGTASNPTTYLIGANPVAAAAGDLNGDLSPDVVVSNNGGVGGTPVISILFGNGDGTLGTAPCASGCGPGTRLDIPGVGLSPQGIVVGDVNGDSYPDIAVVDDSHGATDGVKVFLGNGLGCFGNTASLPSPCGPWTPVTLVPGTLPRGIGMADVNGDGKPDLFVANTVAPGLTLFTNNLAGAAACGGAVTPPGCITPRTPCVGMDININNVVLPGPGLVRGYSLTLRLSADLVLCLPPSPIGGLPSAAFVKGTYLSGPTGARNTEMHVTSNGNGVYTIDEAILDPATPGGASCGPNATSGKLFTVYLGGLPNVAAFDTVVVMGLTLRDCNNGALTAFACPTASQGTIKVKTVDVLPVTNLVVTQERTMQAAASPPPFSSTTAIDVLWTPVVDPNSPESTTRIDIWRAPYLGPAGGVASAYPDYAGGSPPPIPTVTALYPITGPPSPGPWVKVWTYPGTGGGPPQSHKLMDTNFRLDISNLSLPQQRGYWYYLVARVDECGVPSKLAGLNQAGTAFSVTTESNDDGTLDYELGDVAGGGAQCLGDDKVELIDLTDVLSNVNNSKVIPPGDPLACLDFGPTTAKQFPPPPATPTRPKLPERGRPIRDGIIGSEEVIIMGFNFRVPSSPALAALPQPSDHDELSLDAPGAVVAGQDFKASLPFVGAGDLHGVVAELGWDPSVADPVAVEPGPLATAQDGIVVSAGPAYMIAIVPGAEHPGFAGTGVLARVRFRAKANGDPKIRIARLDGRDRQMERVLGPDQVPTPPTVTNLAPAFPNPFNRNTALTFSLSVEGDAELGVYSVDGRRVKTLATGRRAAGEYHFTWDGTDGAGRAAPPGVYFLRLITPQARLGHTLVMLR